MATITKADMVERLLRAAPELTRSQARMLVDGFFEKIKAHLQEGRDVKLSGFGNFILKDKNARPGRNPKTGEVVPVSARRVVTFRAGQKLRKRVG